MDKVIKQVFTITFSESVENHVGMQKIGDKLERGFMVKELEIIQSNIEKDGGKCEIINLNQYLSDVDAVMANHAAILIIRNGISLFADKNKVEEELTSLTEIVDKKALMKGRVVNKIARWNLCFADEDQEPDYQNRKGRVINFSHLPHISGIRKNMGKYMMFDHLYAELNYYYDIEKCGIGFHGDSERKVVIGARIGASMDLHYQWYKNHQPVGKRCQIPLHNGDMYIMSDKAVGHDWKRYSVFTLRHSTGGSKYTS